MKRYEYTREEGSLADIQHLINEGWRVVGWKWFERYDQEEWLLEIPVEDDD